MISKDTHLARLEQRTQIMGMLMVLVLLVLLLQFWLLSVAIEEFLAARATLAIPTFGASCCCLLVNLGLLKYLFDIDREEK